MPAGLSKGARGTHGLRVLVALLGTLVPLAPGLVSGCGSSGSTAAPAPTVAISSDAAIPLVMVVTGGGGAPTSSGSSSSGGVQNPLGDLPVPDSGSSSGASSGSGSGNQSDDGSSASALPDGALGDGATPSDNTTPHCPSDYVVSLCGSDPCDYRTSTCCVDIMGDSRCIPGNKSKCNSNEASIHCLQACECDTGRVCCGVANTILGVVTSECETIPDGGICNPHPQTNTQASEQLCGTDEECTAGQGCITQTCEYGVTLQLCGLISQDPFDCHM